MSTELPTEQKLSRMAAVLLAVVLTVVGLLAAFMIKKPCVEAGFQHGDQYRKNCYTDIAFLYPERADEFKKDGYKPFAAHGLAYRDNNLEYPPFTGLFISGMNAFVKTNDQKGFLSVNAFGLALFALAAAAALSYITADRWRIVLFAISPAMLSYAFHNWDLLPVGFLALGMWAFVRGKDGVSGAMLGLGAAAKLFPGFAVLPFALARWKQGGSGWKIIGQSVLWFALPNVVVISFAGIEGWAFPIEFQGERFPNYETLSYFIYHHGRFWWRSLGNDFWFGANGGSSVYAQVYNYASWGVFLVTMAWLLRREWRRDEFRPFVAAFGCVILWLLTAKVYSPQFALWLLPFFVVVRMPIWTFVAFAVTDLVVLGSIWAYFVHFADETASEVNFYLLETAVYARYAALGVILWWSRRAEEALRPLNELRLGPATELWTVEPVAAVPAPAPVRAPVARTTPAPAPEPRSSPVVVPPPPPRPAPEPDAEPASVLDLDAEPEIEASEPEASGPEASQPEIAPRIALAPEVSEPEAREPKAVTQPPDPPEIEASEPEIVTESIPEVPADPIAEEVAVAEPEPAAEITPEPQAATPAEPDGEIALVTESIAHVDPEPESESNGEPKTEAEPKPPAPPSLAPNNPTS